MYICSMFFETRLFIFAQNLLFSAYLIYPYEAMIEKIDILQHSEGSHLGFHSGKEFALTLNTQCLYCDNKCHYLQIGECGYDTMTGVIFLLIYLILCKFLADLEYFPYVCNVFGHVYDNSTYVFRHY